MASRISSGRFVIKSGYALPPLAAALFSSGHALRRGSEATGRRGLAPRRALESGFRVRADSGLGIRVC